MKGQISFFENVNIIWKRYPGCTKGICPLCGTIAWYGPTSDFGSYENDAPECECGARFTEKCPPKGLPVLSGLNDLPIRRNAWKDK